MLLKKLFSHLRILEAEEERLFLRWLQSPYHNRNQKLIQMFRYLKKSSPKYEGRRLDSELIHKALHPNKIYKETRIKLLGVELLNQLYQFWIDRQQQTDATVQQLLLWEKLHKAGLKSEARRFKNRCKNTLFDIKPQLQRQDLSRLKYTLLEHQQILDAGKRDQEPKLQEINDALDQHYYYQKLKNYCKSLIQRKFTVQDYHFPLIDHILDQVANNKIEVSRGLKFFSFAALALKQEHDPTYFEMKQILFEETGELDSKEIPFMLLVARNYCIQRVNQRAGIFMPELFAIYQLEIDLGLIAVDGQIPAATYKNIAQLSLLLKKYDWLESFLNQYRDAVDERSYFFNLAILRFTQSRFEEVITLFEQADYQEILMSLSAKTWQLKTYFELWLKYPEQFSYDEKLEAHITAFTTYLNRRKSSLPKHYHYHLNFGKFVRELLRKSRPYARDQKELQDLLDRVHKSEQLADRGWLLEKLEAIMAS